MVDDPATMTQDDFDQLINDNPPGSPAPEPEDGSNSAQAAEGVINTDSSISDTNAEPDNSNQDDGDTPPSDPHDSNQAFAAMRIQNKKMQEALQAVLQQSGLDPSLAANPEQLIQNAENARLEEEAKKQKVPTELLQRLTQLERTNLEHEQKRLADAALSGFQEVKNKFNLSTQDISEFAKQLQDAGTNPFEQEMDLVQQYKLHNLDKIIAAESKKAVEDALRTQNSAVQHSTTPSKNQGKDSNGADTIDTMAKFDRFLQNLK